MRRLSSPGVLALLFLALAVTTPGEAQSLRRVPRTGGFGALQIGGGNFTVGCDSLCTERELGASHMALLLGAQVTERIRLEGGIHIQKNRDESSDLFVYSAGAAVYLVRNLHVRGGVAFYRPSTQETGGSFEGSGGPGFLVGAGYDVPLLNRLHLTPYVQYSSGGVSSLERTAGGAAATTGADVRSVSFGIALSGITRTWDCTTAAGQRLRLNRRNVPAFLACVREVEARVGTTRFKR